jgi:hypothetical protein
MSSCSHVGLILLFGLEQLADLIYFGVPTCFLLGIDQVAVDHDLENTALRRDELPRSNTRLKLCEQFLRHPDGARGIVSLRAVFDLDVPHGILSWVSVCVPVWADMIVARLDLAGNVS